jgi:hypothetical protein
MGRQVPFRYHCIRRQRHSNPNRNLEFPRQERATICLADVFRTARGAMVANPTINALGLAGTHNSQDPASLT